MMIEIFRWSAMIRAKTTRETKVPRLNSCVNFLHVTNTDSYARPARAVLLVVVSLCAVHALVVMHGLSYPPDPDTLRDAGLVQGLLDGNLFGDPVNQGAWRWYPPGIHVVLALLTPLSGLPAAGALMWLAPWLNLLAPVTFFAMSERLFGSAAAAIATLVFVLFNGAFYVEPAMSATYTPWPLTPNMALPIFFAGIMVIERQTIRLRVWGAVLTGAVLGFAFLAHTVPALLLSGIVFACVVARHGITPRAILWLALVAIIELAIGALFLVPLLVAYRLHIVNPIPGSWVEYFLNLGHPKLMLIVAALNFPGLVALATTWALRRRAPLSRVATAILAAWIGISAAFLIRYYACGFLGNGPGICRVAVIPVHHFHFYLQAAWACLIGHACWQVWQRDRLSPAIRRMGAAAAILLALAGSVWFIARPMDMRIRALALAESDVLDPDAYLWIHDNTRPADLFVTELIDDPNTTLNDVDALTVMAAGRRLVAAPALHSNPYIDWPSRDERRRRYLAAIKAGPDASNPALCDLAREAGSGAAVWALLPRQTPVATQAASPAHATEANVIYRITPRGCPGQDAKVSPRKGRRDGGVGRV
jgi:hypothetical protein